MAHDAMPRPEHPRPQWIRQDWINLNGPWSFEVDPGRSGRERGLVRGPALAGTILVPFCPESRLSGVGQTDFMAAVWYRRSFRIPETWAGSRVLLHFGAVDYDAEAWVNGVSAGRHRGGYVSFSFDVTSLLRDGENVLVVCAEDDVRSGLQPRGKQSGQYHSHNCDYTRTTGIWQTVWLERVPDTHLAFVRTVPDPENGRLHLEATFNQAADGGRLFAEALFEGRPMGRAAVRTEGRQARLSLDLSETHLWEPGAPRLYDLRLAWRPAGCGPDASPDASPSEGADRVDSYFGLRSLSWGGGVMRVNGRPVFQRLVLDQGFYPDGIYTAPSDDELRRDIERSMAMGFNGARLHQKIFEERFLYWADRLGYLVWGEQGSWGLDISGPAGLERFLPEWLEALRRDCSHPALVGWCPFNETTKSQDDAVLATVVAVTRAFDPTRPVIDTSGYVHVTTDIYDVHDYDQDPGTFAARYAPLAAGGPAFVNVPDRERYDGQPYFVSEFGGIWWNPEQADGKAWGYGSRPDSEAAFLARFRGLVDALLDNPAVCAFCYTQLTDVEQEVNGLYTYDRRPKFDPARIREILARPAAIEIRETEGLPASPTGAGGGCGRSCAGRSG